MVIHQVINPSCKIQLTDRNWCSHLGKQRTCKGGSVGELDKICATIYICICSFITNSFGRLLYQVYVKEKKKNVLHVSVKSKRSFLWKTVGQTFSSQLHFTATALFANQAISSVAIIFSLPFLTLNEYCHLN